MLGRLTAGTVATMLVWAIAPFAATGKVAHANQDQVSLCKQEMNDANFVTARWRDESGKVLTEVVQFMEPESKDKYKAIYKERFKDEFINAFIDCEFSDVTDYIYECGPTSKQRCAPGSTKGKMEYEGDDTVGFEFMESAALVDHWVTDSMLLTQANDQAVTDSMLLSDPAASWLHTNGNLAGHRYSVLTQLNASNADQLNVAWIFSPGGETDAQNTPLYHDGIVYFAQDNTVFAIDARSGRRVWKYEHELPETFGGYNVDFITGKHRGVAIYGDYIYFLSNDSKLHAIHYKTGEQKFVKQYLHYPEDFERTEDGDANGYATTVGPTAIPGGQIIVPLNATDFGGLPGFVYGVNPEDGEVLWECNMIPGPGEPGYESWPGDSADYGGAGPWISGSWDPDLRMYYTGTANAYPWNPKTRGDGLMDNLGAASVVACNTDTGQAAWRYVAVPGDPWDFDIPQTPMIITIDGRKTIVHPNKVGFIHYLDAETGQFLRAPAFVDRLNWIDGYDVEGRPINQLPLPVEGGEAVEVWPSLFGGVNMYPNAYNPLTGNLYLAATNAGMLYKFEEIKVIANVRHFGASVEFIWGYEVELAIDVKTGTEVWRDQKGKWGYAGGMLTTAGNLVFYTSQAGIFHATNATTGEILYTFNLGVTPKAGPITYMLDGKQYVVQPVGGVPGWGFEEHNLDHGSLVVAFSR